MRVAALLMLSSVALMARSADDLETLDEEFLAYLAEFESDEDDWTIVETPPTAPSESVEAATAAKASSERAIVQPSQPQPVQSRSTKTQSPNTQSQRNSSPSPDKGSTR